MRRLAMWGFAVFVSYVVARAFPDVRRYVRIRGM